MPFGERPLDLHQEKTAIQGGGEFCTGIFPQGKIPHGENSAPVQKIKGKIPHLPNLQCIGSKRDPGIAIPKRSWEKAMTIGPEITSVDGVARHSQIIRLPSPLPCWLATTAEEREQNKWERAAKHKAYGGTVAYMDKIPHGENSAPPLEK